MEKTVQSQPESGLTLFKILRLWAPEAASASCLIFMPVIVDLFFVAKLKSTQTYSAIGMSSNLIHTLIKLSEAISVAGIAVMGRFNGAKKFQDCGKAFFDALAATSIMGGIQMFVVGMGAAMFMRWIEAPDQVRFIAVPFIKVQAVAIFFAFTMMAFTGFFKAVQDTKTPFYVNLFGIGLFLFLDYSLIFGKFGFPALGYLGSALASASRYLSMLSLSALIIFSRRRYKKYFFPMDQIAIHPKNVLEVLKLSLPIMADKTVLSFSYIWLAKMVAPLGVCAIACMDSVKNLERLAFIPAMAFAQIITFIVSNNLGQGDWKKARANIDKILVLSVGSVCLCLMVVCWKSHWLISFFDTTNSFSDSACRILKIVSPLVVFDLVQLTLAGALRGAGDVKTVMLTRLLSCSLVFFPLSYMIRKYAPLEGEAKMIMIYLSFYLATAIIGLVFFIRIRGKAWRKIHIPGYKKSPSTDQGQELSPSPDDAGAS